MAECAAVSDTPDKDRLERSLLRMEASLSRVGTSARATPPRPPSKKSRAPAVAGGGITAACTALVAVGFATGNMTMVYAGLAGLVLGGLLLFTQVGRSFLGHVPGVPVDTT